MTDTATPTAGATAGQDNASTAGDAGGDGDIVRQLSQLVDSADDGAQDFDGAGIDDDSDDGSDDRPAERRQADDAKPDTQDASGDGADAAAEKDADPEALVTVKVDGAEKRVKLSDLVAEYQKGQASTKRFEEAAQARKTVEAERSKINTERTQLADALRHYQARLQEVQQAAQPDWEALLQENPAEFQRQRYYYEQRQAALQQAQAAQAYLAQQRDAEQHNAVAQHLQAEAEKLHKAIPEWSDPAKAKAEREALRASLQSAGLSDEEISGIRDHRAVLLARKAMLYDKMVSERTRAAAEAKAKLDPLPPARVMRPGNADQVSPADGRTKSMQRLSRSGSVRDAAAVLQALI